MLRIFVDSGSSIKQDETEKYGVELIPLKILLGNEEFEDGVNLTMDKFYHELIVNKLFPKTSLPNLVKLEERVNECTKNGDDVIIVTISSKISGTYNAIRLLFEENEKVRIIDSHCAVGGMRLIVDCINRNKEKSLDDIVKEVKKLIPRIIVMAIPETLNYLLRGGRLSKPAWLVGSILKIKPIIGFVEGKVKSLAKTRSLKSGMEHIVNALKELKCDPDYDIIASYTYDKTNLEKLVDMTDEVYKKQIRVYDNLDPAIACHWGPNAFGYIFVSRA